MSDSDEADAYIARLRGPLLQYFGTTDPELLAEVWGDRARLNDAASDEPRPLARHEAEKAMAEIPWLNASDEPREEYVPSQSCEDDYLAIDGALYPNRPLASVIAAVLAKVARHEREGLTVKDIGGDVLEDQVPMEPASQLTFWIERCAHDIAQAKRLKAAT